MVMAYVMVRVDSGKEREVLKEASKWGEVKEAHIIYGEWDLILKVEVGSIEEITSFVVDKLRTTEGVKLTSTMIVAE